MLELDDAVSRLSLRARLLLGVVVLATVGLRRRRRRHLHVAPLVPGPPRRRALAGRPPRVAERSRGSPGRAPGRRAPRRRPRHRAGGIGSDVVELRSRRRVGALRLAASRTFQGRRRRRAEAAGDDRAPGRGTTGPTASATSRSPAVSGGGSYRVRASIERRAEQTCSILATSLIGVDGTLHRLLLIELLVTARVLAAIVGLGLWVVRLGLRPLVAIGAHRRRDRRRRPLPPGRARRAAHRGRPARARAEHDARPDRGVATRRAARAFVADASHELRTPLAAVRAYAELFERGADTRPDDLARSMRGHQRESERMSVLVDDLLLLARLDEGRAARARAGRRSARSRPRRSRRPARSSPTRPIEIDDRAARRRSATAMRLRQVLDNLLANVRAHTPPGTPVAVALTQRRRRRRARGRRRGPGLAADRPARRSSSASTAPTPRARARAAAPGSGCRSSRRSPRRTAAPSRSARSRSAGARLHDHPAARARRRRSRRDARAEGGRVAAPRATSARAPRPRPGRGSARSRPASRRRAPSRNGSSSPPSRPARRVVVEAVEVVGEPDRVDRDRCGPAARSPRRRPPGTRPAA